MPKKSLSNSQIVSIVLLWLLICYIILTYSKEIDLQVILAIFFSGAFIFIPIYKSIRKKKNKK